MSHTALWSHVHVYVHSVHIVNTCTYTHKHTCLTHSRILKIDLTSRTSARLEKSSGSYGDIVSSRYAMSGSLQEPLRGMVRQSLSFVAQATYS